MQHDSSLNLQAKNNAFPSLAEIEQMSDAEADKLAASMDQPEQFQQFCQCLAIGSSSSSVLTPPVEVSYQNLNFSKSNQSYLQNLSGVVKPGVCVPRCEDSSC